MTSRDRVFVLSVVATPMELTTVHVVLTFCARGGITNWCRTRICPSRRTKIRSYAAIPAVPSPAWLSACSILELARRFACIGANAARAFGKSSPLTIPVGTSRITSLGWRRRRGPTRPATVEPSALSWPASGGTATRRSAWARQRTSAPKLRSFSETGTCRPCSVGQR